jgi:hypothetical protein
VLVLTALLVGAFIAGLNVPFKSQIVYFEVIRSVSSIVFGVSGAWLAIMYPKTLGAAKAAKVTSGKDREKAVSEAKDDVNILLGFLKTMIASVGILMFSLAIPFAKEILIIIPNIMTYRELLLGFLYCSIIVLTITQFYLLVITLTNSFKALKEINHALIDSELGNLRDKNRDY